MTLAELKRNANSGKMKMEIIERYGETGDDIIERLRGIRKVLRANSVGLILENLSGTENELRIEKASLMDYDGKTLTIYEAGKREPNEQEKAMLYEWDKIKTEYLKQYPFSDTYWKKRDYFEKSSCPWMSGYEKVKGKRYSYYDGMVIDDTIQGNVILKYNVYFD